MKLVCKQFVDDLERAKGIVARRKGDALAMEIAEKAEQKTVDAEENIASMTEDAKWGTGARGKKAEDELRKKLEEKFMEVFKTKNYSKWHNAMEKHVVATGVGNLEGMQYRGFVQWMDGKRVAKKLISNSAMKAMEDFVTNWKGGD